MNMKTKLLLAILLLFAVPSFLLAQAPSPSGNPPASMAKKVVPDHSPLIAAVDKDKDGCMSEKEWKDAGLPDSAWKMIIPQDKSGCVNEQVMLDTGAPDGIDLNGDEKLTLEEFIEFDKKMSAQMSGGQGGPPALGGAK
jgi:hypothetical protein